AEVHVNAIAVDDRRRRRAAVLGIERTGMIDMKDFDVDNLAAGALVERHRSQRNTADAPRSGRRFNGGRQPDAPVGDHRRGPPRAYYGNFPDDITGLTPLDRQDALR